MSVYAQDSSAEAVVLGDYGKSYFTYSNDKGFQLITERITRVKILTKEGLDWANHQISLYQTSLNKEELDQLKGATFNIVNGEEQKEKLRKEDIFEEQVDDNTLAVKFTLLNAKVGPVLEYSYTLKSDFFYYFKSWNFQSTIPVIYSEYRARIPEYFQHRQFNRGLVMLTVAERENYQDRFDYKYKSMQKAGGRIDKYSGTLTPFWNSLSVGGRKCPGIKERAICKHLKRLQA